MNVKHNPANTLAERTTLLGTNFELFLGHGGVTSAKRTRPTTAARRGFTWRQGGGYIQGAAPVVGLPSGSR